MKILSPAPTKLKVVEDDGPHKSFFTPPWERWFVDLFNKVNASSPPSILAFSGTYSGGGAAYNLNNNFTLQQLSSFILYANALQTYSGTQPTWQLILKLDGSTVVDTGTVSTWQPTAHLCYECTLNAGYHTIEVDWVCSTSAGTLQRLDLVGIPTAI